MPCESDGPPEKRIRRGPVSTATNLEVSLEWVHDVYVRWQMTFQLSVTQWMLGYLVPGRWCQLQAVLAAAMLIVSKFVGDPLQIVKLVEYGDGAFTRAQLFEAEITVLKYLIEHDLIRELVERCYDAQFIFEPESQDSGIAMEE